MPRFFERFREELVRYADGVHTLGAPVPRARLAAAPAGELRDFYASFDGAELFVGSLVIHPIAQLRTDDGVIWFGETGEGDALGLALAGADAGAVVRREEGADELVVEGTSFARWLEGTVVGEAVIYDREGEFRDDVFADDGEGLAPAAEIKRARKALKLDPDAPGPALRLARALEREGDPDGACSVLRRLTKARPHVTWAWFDLGRLLRDASDLAGAERAFAAAAAAEGEHAAFFAAHAARAAAERGDEPSRAKHAERARALDEGVVRGQLRAAQARADEGELDEARELAQLARALAPRDLQVIELVRRLK